MDFSRLMKAAEAWSELKLKLNMNLEPRLATRTSEQTDRNIEPVFRFFSSINLIEQQLFQPNKPNIFIHNGLQTSINHPSSYPLVFIR